MSGQRTARNATFVGAAVGASVAKEVGSMAGESIKGVQTVWKNKFEQDRQYLNSLPKEKRAAEQQRLARENADGMFTTFCILFIIGGIVVGIFDMLFN